jgi:hypothetical protein
VVLKKTAVEKNRVKFRDPRLPGYEIGSRRTELSGDFRIGSYSETVINPLLGYD